jgi:hypothetical protein
MLYSISSFFFILAAFIGIATGFMRRKQASPPEPALPATPVEIVLTALALIPAAVGVNVLVVALTPGMPSMNVLTRYVLLPSIALLIVVWITAYRLGLERLTNRIWTGVWVGAVSTGALDVIRLTGFTLGWLPGNNPRMFGVLILDQMAVGPSELSDFIGELYHYWVGATFGLTYALLAGKTRWWGGLIWGGFFVELGMMTTPPMVIAMAVGYFGLEYGRGWEVLATSVPAHIAFGTVLGLLLERYIRHKGWIWPLMKEAAASLPAPLKV